MNEIIKNDTTLNYFVNEAVIDWNNDFQVALRVNSLKIALNKYIESWVKHNI